MITREQAIDAVYHSTNVPNLHVFGIGDELLKRIVDAIITMPVPITKEMVNQALAAEQASWTSPEVADDSDQRRYAGMRAALDAVINHHKEKDE